MERRPSCSLKAVSKLKGLTMFGSNITGRILSEMPVLTSYYRSIIVETKAEIEKRTSTFFDSKFDSGNGNRAFNPGWGTGSLQGRLVAGLPWVPN
ncbi:hypothetical protein OEA41_000555 [Lepraria neglecta]|uniref:Uncharacterized protein n=1 Tax=Lepraria neglecta TaxID=209136 RepID=A0AAE0DPW3_9LECA|nr:hypothetical protein OEA41_000555 [Lepraria neglecta]